MEIEERLGRIEQAIRGLQMAVFPDQFQPPPAPPVERTYEERFEDALNDHGGLSHFSAKELLYLGDSNSDDGSPAFNLNALPPESLWGPIIITGLIWDEIRNRLGHPIRLSSIYRNEAYNRAVGGVSGSFHMKGVAADGLSYGAKPELIAAHAMKLRREGFFNGGIGLYNTFVHVDHRGTEANWDYRSTKTTLPTV